MSSTNHLPTSTAYDQWSTVYDTDGNVLQQLDDLYVTATLPLLSIGPTSTVVELGCGTGRNTLKLVNLGAHVVAVDNSPGMLSKLQQKLSSHGNNDKNQVRIILQDLTTVSTTPNTDFRTAIAGKAISGVVSTLVLEHLTLPSFFAAVAGILPPGGWLLLTNMHWEMGAISSAGFHDPVTGEKVKPLSLNHTKEEILAEAEKHGLRLEGEVSEDGPRDLEHARRFGRRAEKWVGVLMHVGMVFRRDVRE